MEDRHHPGILAHTIPGPTAEWISHLARALPPRTEAHPDGALRTAKES